MQSFYILLLLVLCSICEANHHQQEALIRFHQRKLPSISVKPAVFGENRESKTHSTQQDLRKPAGSGVTANKSNSLEVNIYGGQPPSEQVVPEKVNEEGNKIASEQLNNVSLRGAE